ncbi:MAG: Gldg family protein [Brevinematales bacterium]|nr:Gldg family protein [Brevinematales bacterium]
MKNFFKEIKITRKMDLFITLILILLNLFMFLQLVERVYFRFDLTNDRKYSLSNHTRDVLKEIKKPLSIKVFFSPNLPAPYNSYERYLKDLLLEYRSIAKDKIKIEFVDLKKNPDAPKDYGIFPMTIEVVEKDQVQYKNSYLGVAFSYGDMIEKIQNLSTTEGLEYKITAIIKKMIDKVNKINSLDGSFEVILLGNTNIPVENIENLEKVVASAVLNVKEKLNGKVTYSFIDTINNKQKAFELINKHKLPPINLSGLNYNKSLFPDGKAYIGIILKYKDSYRVINILEEDEEGTIYLMGKYMIEEILMGNVENLLAIKKKVGYLMGHGEPYFIDPYGSEESGDSVSRLAKFIDENYEFKPITIQKTPIPDDVDMLLIVEPKFPISEEEFYKIDQFIMKGKPVVVFASGLFFPISDKAELMSGNIPVGIIPKTGLLEFLSNYGIGIENNLILDRNCYKIEIPKIYGGGVQNVYYAPLVERENISQHHSVTKKVKGMYLLKSSSIKILDEKDRKIDVLIKTSKEAWQEREGISLSPAYIGTRIPSKEKMTNFVTAISIVGKFKSAFNRQDPAFIPETEEGKILVVASGDMAKNSTLDIEGTSPNSIFVRNIIDWALGNEKLIDLRVKGLSYNPPKKTSDFTKSFIKWFNTFGTAFIVILVGIILWQLDVQRRKKIKKEFLDKFSKRGE